MHVIEISTVEKRICNIQSNLLWSINISCFVTTVLHPVPGRTHYMLMILIEGLLVSISNDSDPPILISVDSVMLSINDVVLLPVEHLQTRHHSSMGELTILHAMVTCITTRHVAIN